MPHVEPNYHPNAIISKYTEDDNSIVSNEKVDRNTIVNYPMRNNGEPMFLYGAPGVNFFLRAGAIGTQVTF